MKELLKDIYITILSKNIEWDMETRITEARWLLVELGVPMFIDMPENQFSKWNKWAKWIIE